MIQNLQQHLQSLNQLLEYEIDQILPGHGPAEEKSAIDRNITHRLKRETQIHKLFLKSRDKKSIQEILEEIYVPEGVNPKLYPAARNNILVHCLKLLLDGKITNCPESLFHFNAL